MRPAFTLALFTFLFTSCSLFNKNEQEQKGKILAQVGDRYLYLKDIGEIVNPSMDNDSADIINNYINIWVKRQLLLLKAEEQLPEEINEIEKKVQDYKESLIIYRFEQELIKQKLDTVISSDAISAYYEQYKNNFILEFDVVDVSYVKLLSNSPTKDSVGDWFFSGSLEDLLKLEEFSSQYAVTYNLNESNWIGAELFVNMISMEEGDFGDLLMRKEEFKLEEENYSLFVKVKGKRLKGSEAPLEYVEDDIKKILLNKNKILLLDEINDRIYSEGTKQNKFKIFFN
ncbi:MAG: hypothetical protein HKN92_03525 [Chitinophagales bacterium]|nr:hypothetical protein [Chitinophagales bacterium]